MKIKQIYYSNKFAKCFKKINQKDRLLIDKREKIFKQNPFDPKLKTHKLTGKLKEFWAFSITHSERIMFAFIEDNSVMFLEVGGHEIYK